MRRSRAGRRDLPRRQQLALARPGAPRPRGSASRRGRRGRRRRARRGDRPPRTGSRRSRRACPPAVGASHAASAPSKRTLRVHREARARGRVRPRPAVLLPARSARRSSRRARDIDGQHGDVDARPERLRAAGALAGERAVAVGDANDHAVVHVVVPEHGAHDEVPPVEEHRRAQVPEPAREGAVERPAADEPPEQGAIEGGEPGSFQADLRSYTLARANASHLAVHAWPLRSAARAPSRRSSVLRHPG